MINNIPNSTVPILISSESILFIPEKTHYFSIFIFSKFKANVRDFDNRGITIFSISNGKI